MTMGFVEQAAVAFATKNIPVFPCRPLDKKPLTQRGFKDASVDVSQIAEWWEERWPNAMIGMPTGPASGLLVIDVDAKTGGPESFIDLQTSFGALPETRRSVTGGGGFHYFFKYSEGVTIRNSTGKVARGIDIRGLGGYVILPPSVNASGNAYEWLNDTPYADAPKWLIDLLAEKQPRTTAPTNGEVQKIPEGQRNSFLTSLAGSLRTRGAAIETLEAALLAENASRCTPPLPDAEVRAIARSVGKYPVPEAGQDQPPPVVWDSDKFLVTKFPEREPLVVVQGYGTPVLTRQSLNNIFAKRGTGKSVLALSLAGATNVGGTFLNWQILKPLRVLYVDGELPDPQIQERMRALFPPNARIKLITLDSQPKGIPNLATAQGQAWLNPLLADIDLLILDSLPSLAPFATNDEESWLPFNVWLMQLRSRGLCVLYLSQAGRVGLARGHTRGEDPLDLQIKLEADELEDSDQCRCKLLWEKFRGNRERGGIRALQIECQAGQWSYSLLEEDKLRTLEEYRCLHPTASFRTIAKEHPELGSISTIHKLQEKLDKRGGVR